MYVKGRMHRMGLWRVWNKTRILWVFSLMTCILFYLLSSDLSGFVLYRQDGQCVCVLAAVESFAVEHGF